MRSKFIVAAPICILALGLAGCGGSTGGAGSNATSDLDCSSPETFCVGLVTDGGKVDDKSFNQAAWGGVQRARDTLGAHVRYIETTDAKDYTANIKQFTDQKYDAVVTVGFLMTDPTAAAAAQNPGTKFIGVDEMIDTEKVKSPNLTGLTFPADQAGYAVGYLAGLLTKTGKIGAINGLEIPPVQKYFKGYEAGAKASNPNVQVVGVYHPASGQPFNDPVWGAGEAKKQLAQGVDVIFGIGSNTGNGALNEVAKSSDAGTTRFCIGVDVDQWSTLPEARPCMVTSAEKLIADGVAELLGQAEDGTMKSGNFMGKTGISQFHDFDSKIPAEVKTKVEQVVKKLADGSLQTNVVL
ncbi:BMP family ABC transporter substrate-binding protein [Micromonospora sp. NPDC005324]|uniref:BMP family lipoprotein n=1 Tax=Micromonospora sp. NPDC005324 TaxID=3157033 RepID=UPI0033AA199D